VIELVSVARCIGCDICVRICPTNVFESAPNGIPIVARQADCQTCFMCEAYCPVDALFVAPEIFSGPRPINEEDLVHRGLLGSYRAALGWGGGQLSTAADDATHEVIRLALAEE